MALSPPRSGARRARGFESSCGVFASASAGTKSFSHFATHSSTESVGVASSLAGCSLCGVEAHAPPPTPDLGACPAQLPECAE